MTTTTATTSTPTPTAAATTAGVTKSATQQLLTSLNTGSGVDTGSLVTSLVQAQFAAKTAALTARTNALTAQLSATTTLKSTITNFSSALGSLTSGGTLQTQPVSGNASVVTASAIPGSKIGALASSITVGALATAQSARSAAFTSRTSAVTTAVPASMTLTLGTATYSADGTGMASFSAGTAAGTKITITDGSLDGIAAAINTAKTGVTASVITNTNGEAVLSLKGSTGTAQAFTLTADGGDAALAKLNVGPGATATTLTATAANARVTVDGVTVERSGNTISDLVPGVKLQLNSVSSTPVSLGSTRPTSAVAQAISDFVETYNQVYASAKAVTDPINGELKTDPAAKTLLRSLQTLTTKTLVSVPGGGGAPTTLAALGIGTNRDGTLTLNADTMNRMLAAYPDEVEAMFATTSGNAIGLQSSISGIALAASSSTLGLGASASRYTKAQTALGTEQDKITSQSEAMTTRLTQQFSSMNSKVTAYKATQTFLENQIKAWNADN